MGRRINFAISLLFLGFFPAMVMVRPAIAKAASANISHAYHAASPIKDGRLVSLDPKRSDYIQPSNTTNASKLIGVSVPYGGSLLAVDETNGDSIQVATSGSASIVASTLNGPIEVGTQIGVSPLNGIGMKAISGERVVGLAQSPLSTNASGSTQQDVTDKSGHKTKVTVGYITINIVVGNNTTAPLEQRSVLQRAGRALAGHAISNTRIIISLLIIIIASITLVSLVYASVHGSIVAVGRNPLARDSIMRSVGVVFVMVLVVAAVAVVTITFLLR